MNKSKLKRALILGCALFLGTGPEGYVSAAGGITYEEGFVVDEDHKGVVRPIRPAEVLVNRNNAKTKEPVKSDSPSSAAKKGKKAKDTGISPEHPLTFTADYIRYNHSTGDVMAEGRIDMRQMMDQYTTEYVYGNTVTQQYVIPGEVHWKNPTTDMTAQRAEYDGAASIGKFYDFSGWDSGLYYFKGDKGTYYRKDNKMVADRGYFTTKHAVAKVPDYRIEADTIEIYPGDHYTAYDVKLKVKNTTLISFPKYRASLKNDNAISPWSLLPRPKYDSDNGWGWHNGLELPVAHNDDLYFYIRNEWYTKSGYKPDVGFSYSTPFGWFNFHYAEKESSINDEGGLWIKKRPALEFKSNRYYLFKSPFYAGINGEIGYWDEERAGGNRKGSYKGFDVYISGDPVKLGKFLTFNWRTGIAKDYYGYQNEIRENKYYFVGLMGGYRAVSGWINYTNRAITGYTPYLYDTFSTTKPIDIGFRLELTPKDAVSVSWTIDAKNGNVDHRYYTYYRDMHSFYGWIRYDTVEKKTTFMIMPKDFRF